jgi:glycosyltransferase involved in cell wall biosynthesis
MEAMSQAVPVVVTAVGAMREVVEHRVSGRIVRAADEKELARAITSFLRDPRLANTCGQAARKRIREHFSVDRTIMQTLRLYDGMLPDENLPTEG